MKLFSNLKLIFKTAKPAGKFIEEIKGARLKYKTLPFWISILGSAASLVAALQGIIPATTAVIITSSIGAIYNILRGADKANQEGLKPSLKSTEFWVGSLAILSNSIIDMQTHGVNAQVLVSAQSVLGAIMAIAQNLGANQPMEISPVAPPKK